MSVTKVPMRGVNTAVDTAAGDDANIGWTAGEGLILTGQGSTNDITIKNDADADVIKIATGGTTTTFTGDVTMTGTTPTLTIGDAGAEDAAIVFDGNAQDFHIGLDDTADSLAIGLGSALGTTDHMIFDAAGHIRKPLSCAFSVILSATQSNVTGDGTRYTIPLNSAEFDVNSDFDTTNNKFVAPVAGTYCFQGGVGLGGLTDSHTLVDAFFYDETDNWYQYSLDGGEVRNSGGNLYIPLGATIKMAAATEVVMQVQVNNGAAVVDIHGASYPFSWMTGFLVG